MNPQFDPRLHHSPASPPSLAGKILSVLLGAIFLVLAFMFSIVALAVVAVGGTVFAGWLWWKTRALRKAMQESRIDQQTGHTGRTSPTEASKATVIDGEFVREATPTAHLPDAR